LIIFLTVTERQSLSVHQVAKPPNTFAGIEMNTRSVVKILVHLSRFGLAALFLFTAGAKLAIVTKFAGNVAELLSSLKLNYERWQWPVTIAVIVTEIIAAVLLVIPRTMRIGAVLGGLMLIGFSGFALYYVYVLHGEALECGCFGGIIASQLGVQTALRNLGLLIPALIVFFGARRVRAGASPPSQPERSTS
jgi:methylamine utilization protein MauE